MSTDSSRANLRRPAFKEQVRSPYIPRQCPHVRVLLEILTIRNPNHQRCTLFEDMIGKPDELRAAVANCRSRSVRTFRSGYTLSIGGLNCNTISASRLPPRARCQAIGASPITPAPFFLTRYIAIIAQRNTEAPICSLRAPTARPATSPQRCEQGGALYILVGFLRRPRADRHRRRFGNRRRQPRASWALIRS